MERRGGCCIAMCGRGGEAADAWKVGRIMLKFRPIAPRPASAAVVAPNPAETPAPAKRPKRKGSAGGAGRGRRPRKAEAAPSSSKDDEKSSSSSSTSSSTIVTLPLMPETPERKDQQAESPKNCLPAVVLARMGSVEEGGAAAGVVVAPRPVRAVGSWVTVECMTDTWREGEVAWRSDEAVRAALAADECPGFVSDAWGRVTWANEAYRRLVAGSSGRGGEEEEVSVGLLMRGSVPAACRLFTCMVRVRYARRPGSGSTRPASASSLAAPCDVWRLDGGGWAWRLDVKAALSLSL